MKGTSQNLNIRIKPGEVVAVRALDDPNYFRTVFIKPNPYTSGFQVIISEPPVYGEIPDGMREVSQVQVYKQMREMNAGLVMTNNLNAFPFRGHTGTLESDSGVGLVSQQHKNLQKRNWI